MNDSHQIMDSCWRVQTPSTCMMDHLKMHVHTHTHTHHLWDTRREEKWRWKNFLLNFCSLKSSASVQVDEKITVNIIFQMICLHFVLIRIFAHVLYEVNSLTHTHTHTFSARLSMGQNWKDLQKWKSGRNRVVTTTMTTTTMMMAMMMMVMANGMRWIIWLLVYLKQKGEKLAWMFWVTTGNALFHTISNTMKRIVKWFASLSSSPVFLFLYIFFSYMRTDILHWYMDG